LLKKIDKPWGYELLWAHTAADGDKVLHIAKGQKLSLSTTSARTRRCSSTPAECSSSWGTRPESCASTTCRPARRITSRSTRMVAKLDDAVRVEDAYGRATEVVQ
jgi:hypothetical protein